VNFRYFAKRNKIVSIHGRGMGPILQENLGSRIEVCSVFNPNAPLAKLVEEISKLGIDFKKQDHIVIV
jgi:hypothetical protein